MTSSNTRCDVGTGILRAKLTSRLRAIRPKPSQVFVVIDRNARQVVGRKVALAIKDAGLEFQECVAPHGEASKTLEKAQALASKLVKAGADRRSFVLAVGGGVTSDLAGFVAANLFRGVEWGVVSTTLLGMADASIGGKTAVNLPEGKNLFGAFHFPRLVVMDVQMLRTLPAKEWRCGLGEVLKTAMLQSPAMYRKLLGTPTSKLQRGSAELAALVLACTRYKQKIVASDPREGGERKLLNLGHTFGHVLEASAGPRKLVHGEAVALGLLCALQMSVEQGLAAPRYAEEVREFLERMGMRTTYPGKLPGKAVLRRQLLRDKKAAYGKLDVIVPVKPGANLLVQGVDVEEVLPAYGVMKNG
ncbi:MAG: 3-dehydroquinate synthase [Planctomycetota bacterium]